MNAVYEVYPYDDYQSLKWIVCNRADFVLLVGHV